MNKLSSERKVTLLDKFGVFARNHLMTVVVTALTIVWLTVAWFVYKAEHAVQGANITTYGEGIWWGIVTFLTVGYGDKYPITLEGKLFASMLMLTGVGTTGIITAKISSYFMEQALLKGRGIVDTKNLKGHFIVCGWKEDMHELLGHILDFNPDLDSRDLVMIANIQQNIIDAIHSVKRLEKVQVICGDYFEDANLRRAAPERAKKVMILADRTPTRTGQPASPTEVDARTVMTAMNLNSIARGTQVTAEILDPKMDQYLKLAHVSEIIYSREYSRLMLGNASGGTGISNIIFDLLLPNTPTVIATHDLEERFYSKNYPEFKLQYEKENPNTVVIGILENTGNSHTIKEMALRKAQKTPDIGTLVQNLKLVKELKCNHPIFNPPADYSILEGSMVIVIESRQTAQGGRHYEGTQASA